MAVKWDVAKIEDAPDQPEADSEIYISKRLVVLKVVFLIALIVLSDGLMNLESIGASSFWMFVGLMIFTIVLGVAFSFYTILKYQAKWLYRPSRYGHYPICSFEEVASVKKTRIAFFGVRLWKMEYRKDYHKKRRVYFFPRYKDDAFPIFMAELKACKSSK